MPLTSVARVGAVAASVLLALTACAPVVGGTARPAPGMRPRPLTGQTVKRVLLDNVELSKILSQPLQSDPNSPPRFGGRNQLFDMDSLPRECAPVVFALQKSAYGSATVKETAQETWWSQSSHRAKVISVSEVVVAVSTAKEADALFAGFEQQWQHCDGTTVTEYGMSGERFLTAAISDVAAADSVLAATVRSRIVTTIVNARALGVRDNCLVEVKVAFFSNRSDNSAIDIAHHMMNKVSDLS